MDFINWATAALLITTMCLLIWNGRKLRKVQDQLQEQLRNYPIGQVDKIEETDEGIVIHGQIHNGKLEHREVEPPTPIVRIDDIHNLRNFKPGMSGKVEVDDRDLMAENYANLKFHEKELIDLARLYGLQVMMDRDFVNGTTIHWRPEDKLKNVERLSDD